MTSGQGGLPDGGGDREPDPELRLRGRRHFRFDEEGVTNEVVDQRRPSSYFVPIAAAKERGDQQAFETEWTKDRIEESEHVNRIRARVALWREGGHQQVTTTTRRLLEYWAEPDRERTLFFCQLDAVGPPSTSRKRPARSATNGSLTSSATSSRCTGTVWRDATPLACRPATDALGGSPK
jgi:hypothetical protein